MSNVSKEKSKPRVLPVASAWLSVYAGLDRAKSYSHRRRCEGSEGRPKAKFDETIELASQPRR